MLDLIMRSDLPGPADLDPVWGAMYKAIPHSADVRLFYRSGENYFLSMILGPVDGQSDSKDQK